ncbi:hypothetical protein [Deinococcus pimensis]|uniref:hypothetical protein n=1 Tax=Deinococcus pimensis TaxID=309888 RepID=UPI0004814A5D|nr:hypothetical protein [Deinococcus pimensis]
MTQHGHPHAGELLSERHRHDLLAEASVARHVRAATTLDSGARVTLARFLRSLADRLAPVARLTPPAPRPVAPGTREP